MADISKDSISSVRFSLRVDGDPHFLILLGADGLVKRMGYSALSRHSDSVVTGRVPGGLQHVLEEMPDALLGRAGVYEDPGTEGRRCQWQVEFDSASGPVRFDLAYCARSAGLPPAIAKLVAKAESLTDALYSEHLAPDEEPSLTAEVPQPSAPAYASIPTATAQAPVARTGDIRDYLSFDGRIGRVNYLLHYMLPLTALGFAGGFADGLVGLGSAGQVGPMGALVGLITLWPSMAGWAKRLHDFDTSLWIVPKLFLGGGVAAGISFAIAPGLGIVAMAVWCIALLVLMLVTYLRPGTPGPNQYGPDPRVVGPVA